MFMPITSNLIKCSKIRVPKKCQKCGAKEPLRCVIPKTDTFGETEIQGVLALHKWVCFNCSTNKKGDN